MRKELSRFVILAVYLSIFCLRYFSIWFAIPFVIGGVLGFYFSYVEGLVSLFLRQQEKQEQQEFYHLLKTGKMSSLASVIERQIPEQSMIRSWLFVLVYMVMGLFVLTSTQSFIGEGLVLGLGLQYLIDFLSHRKKFSHLLKVYGPMEEELLRKVPVIFFVLFIIFSLLGLRML